MWFNTIRQVPFWVTFSVALEKVICPRVYRSLATLDAPKTAQRAEGAL
jgi:hypothetical protein